MTERAELKRQLRAEWLGDIQNAITMALRGGVASGGVGGAGGNFAPAPHALSSALYHSGTLSDTQAPQFLKTDGSRPLTGNLPVASGTTIDGVDLSAFYTAYGSHISDPEAHQNKVTLGTNPGLQFSSQSAQADLSILLDTDSGLQRLAGGLSVDLAATPGLQRLPTGLSVLLDSNPGLTLATGLRILLQTDPGLTLGATGLSLGAPVAVSATSANNISGASHSHAVTASSAPGAAASLLKSTGAGGLTLESFDSNGYVKAAQDLWGGAGTFKVIFHAANLHYLGSPAHSHVIVNPTLSWAFDEQFGVDIDDNLLVRGFIVGRHALQIKGAKLIAHFDGYEPYETDLTGESSGHMGQVGTSTVKPVYRPGRFGKAVQITDAVTNETTNPSWETNENGWANSIVAYVRDSVLSYTGLYSAKLTAGASQGFIVQNAALSVPNGSSVTVQARCYQGTSGTGRLAIFDATNTTIPASVDATVTDEWELLTCSWTNNTGGAVNVHIRLYNLKTDSSTVVRYDEVMRQTGLRASPYFDGSFNGATWSGTAHGSTSSLATGSDIRYADIASLPSNKGTIGLWVRYPWGGQGNGAGIGYLFSSGITTGVSLRKPSGSRNLIWRIGNTTDHTATAALPADSGWHYITLTWDVPNGRSALYVDGALVQAELLGGHATPAHGAMYIGSRAANADIAPGWYDDLLIVNRELTDDEVRAIYDSDAPVFGETSTFQFRAGRNLVWADAEGLWMIDTAGNPVLGASGVDGQSWGGLTLNSGDILFGRYGAATGGWLLFDRDGVSSLPYLSIGYKDKVLFALDSGGATLDGVLDISTTGGIYQGSGSFATPTTGLKVYNSGGTGKISGYNGGTEQWAADTDGRLKAGAGNVVLDAVGMKLLGGGGWDVSPASQVRWYNDPAAGTTLRARIGAGRDATDGWNQMEMSVEGGTNGADLYIDAKHSSGLIDLLINSNSILAVSDSLLRFRSSGATGSPALRFYQVGTFRGYVQYNDGGDGLELASKYGPVLILPGSGGTEVETVDFTTARTTFLKPIQFSVDTATIAGGAITVTSGWMKVDTEAAAATDDLDTISGGAAGQILILSTANSGRDVVVKHNTGNIVLNGSADFTLSVIGDKLTLMYDNSNSRWCEIGRGNNG